jgi:hypothetical protein
MPGRMTPTRRAVLKAAVTAGAFAVPLIASFSMDAASAQDRSERHHVSNMFVVSNMFCSNQSTVAPTGFCSARVSGSGPHGPEFGSVLLAFLGGPFAQMDYVLEVAGDVDSLDLAGTSVFGPASLLIEDPGRSGTVRGAQAICLNGVPPEAGLATLFELAEAGELKAYVRLANGTELSGKVDVLGADGLLGAEHRVGL